MVKPSFHLQNTEFVAWLRSKTQRCTFVRILKTFVVSNSANDGLLINDGLSMTKNLERIAISARFAIFFLRFDRKLQTKQKLSGDWPAILKIFRRSASLSADFSTEIQAFSLLFLPEIKFAFRKDEKVQRRCPKIILKEQKAKSYKNCIGARKKIHFWANFNDVTWRQPEICIAVADTKSQICSTIEKIFALPFHLNRN